MTAAFFAVRVVGWDTRVAGDGKRGVEDQSRTVADEETRTIAVCLLMLNPCRVASRAKARIVLDSV